MFFRLCYESKSLVNRVNLDTPLEFVLPGNPPVQIKVRKSKADNSDRALLTEAECIADDSAIIEAIADYSLIRECAPEFEKSLISFGERIVYSDLDNGILGYRDKSDNIVDFPKFNSWPLDSLPPDLQEYLPDFKKYLGTIYSELADDTEKFIKTLRWRCDIPGEHHSLQSSCIEFSIDGSNWHPVPTNGPSMDLIEISVTKPLSDEVHNQLISLWGKGGEPLYHELFREAWDQRENNPRSAIVIGIAAAESALKQCIAKFVPDAEWLVQELPSPPIDKIMKKYLPKLIRAKFTDDAIKVICKEKDEDKVIPKGKCKKKGKDNVISKDEVKNEVEHKNVIPDDISKEIIKGVEVRNKIAHAGKIPARTKEEVKKFKEYLNNIAQATEKLLLNIRDLLWIIDYYCGHDWALHNIREEKLNDDGKLVRIKKTPEITEAGWASVFVTVKKIKDDTDISKHKD